MKLLVGWDFLLVKDIARTSVKYQQKIVGRNCDPVSKKVPWFVLI